VSWQIIPHIYYSSAKEGRSCSAVCSGLMVCTAYRDSSVIQVTCSVPQGSVLGPLLFILYTVDLADLASKLGVKLHEFADDNQLHVHCDLSNALSSVNALEQCVIAIGHCSQWMSANRLKLNAEKTVLMWAGTRYTVTSFLRLNDSTLTL